MRFKFTGKYTNGHTAVDIHGVVFEGHDPVEVKDEDKIAKLKTHPEVASVTGPAPKAKSDD
jgi:hypothetical protein